MRRCLAAPNSERAPGSGSDLEAKLRKSLGSGGAVPMIVTGSLIKTTWGSSYASTQEHDWIRYRGKARAMANIYSGKRVVGVSFRYKKYKADRSYYYSPTYKSGAVSTGSSWTAGKEKSVIVLDSLDAPSDLKTKWERWATLVSTSLY